MMRPVTSSSLLSRSAALSFGGSGSWGASCGGGGVLRRRRRGRRRRCRCGARGTAVPGGGRGSRSHTSTRSDGSLLTSRTPTPESAYRSDRPARMSCRAPTSTACVGSCSTSSRGCDRQPLGEQHLLLVAAAELLDQGGRPTRVRIESWSMASFACVVCHERRDPPGPSALADAGERDVVADAQLEGEAVAIAPLGHQGDARRHALGDVGASARSHRSLRGRDRTGVRTARPVIRYGMASNPLPGQPGQPDDLALAHRRSSRARARRPSGPRSVATAGGASAPTLSRRSDLLHGLAEHQPGHVLLAQVAGGQARAGDLAVAQDGHPVGEARTSSRLWLTIRIEVPSATTRRSSAWNRVELLARQRARRLVEDDQAPARLLVAQCARDARPRRAGRRRGRPPGSRDRRRPRGGRARPAPAAAWRLPVDLAQEA